MMIVGSRKGVTSGRFLASEMVEASSAFGSPHGARLCGPWLLSAPDDETDREAAPSHSPCPRALAEDAPDAP